MKHRFKHLLINSEKSVDIPVDTRETTGIPVDVFKDLEADEEATLSFDGGSDDIDNNDDGDGDDGDDDDDDDDEAYLQDKLAVASDEASILSGARVIFQKDPETGQTLMICRVDEMAVPKKFLDGKTMFKADVIFRSFREYSCPKKKIVKIDSKIFKKKNWSK